MVHKEEMSNLRVDIVSAKRPYTGPGCWDILIISNLGTILSNSSEYPYTKMLVFNSSLKTLPEGALCAPKSYTKDFWHISPNVPPEKLNMHSAGGDEH